MKANRIDRTLAVIADREMGYDAVGLEGAVVDGALPPAQARIRAVRRWFGWWGERTDRALPSPKARSQRTEELKRRRTTGAAVRWFAPPPRFHPDRSEKRRRWFRGLRNSRDRGGSPARVAASVKRSRSTSPGAAPRSFSAGATASKLAGVAARARELGAPDVHIIPLDLAARGAGRRFATLAVDRMGPPAGLVANAGFAKRGAFVELPLAEAEAQIRAELHRRDGNDQDRRGGHEGPRERLHRHDDVGGRLRTGPVDGGLRGRQNFALLHFSIALREEMAPFGVRVTSVAAGMMETEFFGTGGDSRRRTLTT